MVLLDFLIEWGTNVFAIVCVSVTFLAFASVIKKYLENRTVNR